MTLPADLPAHLSVEPPAGPPAPPVDPPVDPLRWPDVARQPNAPARAAVARRLLGRIAGQRGLRVELPDGRALVPAPAGAPVLRLRRPQAFFHRIGAGG